MTTQQDGGHAGAALSPDQETPATRAQVQYSLEGLARRCTENPALFGIVTGAVSGALSWLALWLFARRLRDLGLGDVGSIMLPGPIFASAVAFCLWLFGSRNKVILGLAIAIITAGWYGAYSIAAAIATNLSRPIGPVDWSALTLAGIAGGAAGGISAVFAVSLANSRFQHFKTWAVTILVAAAAGTMLAVAIGVGDGGLLLFVSWQAAVLTSISYGLLPAQSRKD